MPTSCRHAASAIKAKATSLGESGCRTAKDSSSGRGVADVAARFARLEDYEKWRLPTTIDFEAILGRDAWNGYWTLWENINDEMRKCQEVADSLAPDHRGIETQIVSLIIGTYKNKVITMCARLRELTWIV